MREWLAQVIYCNGLQTETTTGRANTAHEALAAARANLMLLSPEDEVRHALAYRDVTEWTIAAQQVVSALDGR